MGYSISQRTAELIEKRRKEGRLCQMDRAHIARATVRVKARSWYYPKDVGRVEPQSYEPVFCQRHFDRYIKPWIGVQAVPDGPTNCEYLSWEVF